MGFATSRSEARQLVRHGHFLVNGNKVNIPSYLTKQGDEITVKEKSRELERFKDLAELAGGRKNPDWLEVDLDGLRGKVVRIPAREEIDVPVDEQLIVEHYSR